MAAVSRPLWLLYAVIFIYAVAVYDKIVNTPLNGMLYVSGEPGFCFSFFVTDIYI